MQIALNLAHRALGNVFPNPAVGCVIVKNNVILARGWTQPGGRPHAETVALARTHHAKDATLYVTLEPCIHYGNTPPCTEAIINAQIKRVVVATIDTDKRANGQGIEQLRKAGLTVECGLLEKQAREVNYGYFCAKEHHRPRITLKIATTLDGKIAAYNYTSKYITNRVVQKMVHKLRSTHDGIMIGSGTLLADDPMLTCRIPSLEHTSPVRIVLDSKNKLQSSHKLAQTAVQVPTWVLTVRENPLPHVKNILLPCGTRQHICIKQALSALCSRGITRLLVEGGRRLSTRLLIDDLLDEIIWIRADTIAGNDAIAAFDALHIAGVKNFYCFQVRKVFTIENNIIEILTKE